jgi:phosphatidylinositol kinase/protein kinase (PI-3  family)
LEEEEPSASKIKDAFGDLWEVKKRRLQSRSRFAAQAGADWDMKSVIFKGGDDCRQEVLLSAPSPLP